MAKEKRNATIAWLERSNPLRGLSIAAANSIFDCARNGDTQRLHWMYQEIETQNPVLSMATTRRAGAAANFAWRVSERAAMDGSLSAEQKDAAERFFGHIENLSDLFEHLDLALFRGFAHAQPIWEDDRTVRHIELLDSWKFLKKDGEWLYNPACDGFSSNCVSCRDARLVTVERRRPVDVPALAIHLRAAVGARDWGRFIERYALPKPAVVMAQNATEKDRDDYLESASALENGQVTVWPSGASLMDFAGSSRGVDPFTAFIQHQEKTILMLATGGTLGSMAESGAGTLAGNAQADVWDQIVSRDAGIIAQAVRRSMLNPFLAAAFPGQPVAVDFDFDLTKKPTPKEIFETATAAKNAGYLVAQDELEEATGWKLEKAPESPSPAPGFAMNSQPKPETPLQTRENGFKNAPRDLDGQGDPKAEDALVEALSGLFEKSLAEAAAGEIKNTVDANGQEHDKLGRFGEEGGGAAAKDSPNKPAADKADASGDSGSSEAPAEAATDKDKPDQHGYSANQRAKIGQNGTWQTLGLPAMRDIPPDDPIPLTKIEDARERIKNGETVTNPFGENLAIDNRSLGHINKKGRSPKQLQDKLQSLDAARETVAHPHEIWYDEGNPKNRRAYVRITVDPTGRRVVNAVDEGFDHVLSWHTNDTSFDHYRKGKLLWIRG